MQDSGGVSLFFFFADLEDARGHHRRKREGYEERDENRHGHGPAEGVDVFARVAVHECYRQKDDDQRERCGHDRQADFLRGFDGGVLAVFAFFFHEADDIFEDDDGVVDDDAYGEGERQQCHVVERKIHAAHEREGSDDAGGNGYGGDQDGAPVAHEEKDDGAGENAAEDQVFEERVDGRFDEVGDVVNDKELHAGRELGAQFVELGFDVVGDLHSVGAGLAQDLNADDVFAGSSLPIERGPSAKLFRAIFDLSYIPNADLRAAPRSNDDFAELIGRGDAAERAEAELLRACNHAAAGSLDIFPLERIAHVDNREIVGGQFLGVEKDADLAGLATVQLNAAHAVDGLDGAADLFVGDFGEFAAADGAADEQRENGIGLRVLLSNDGRQSFARQSINGGGYFFADVLGGAVDVAFEDESAGDVGVAFAGVDGDFVDAADAGDGVFEREDNARDDFFGSGAGKLNVDVDGGGIGLGKKIHGEAAI